MPRVPDKYPECEKMFAVHEQSQGIREFIDWLSNEHGWFIAEWDDAMYTEWDDTTYTDRRAMPLRYNMQELLAEYFEIDLDKVEVERQELLAEYFEIDLDKVEVERRELLASITASI